MVQNLPSSGLSAAEFLSDLRRRLLLMREEGEGLLRDVHPKTFVAGKLTRALLVYQFAQNKSLAFETTRSLALAVELAQLASLFLDDWMDHEPFRRKHPAAWKTLGAEGAVLASTQLISQSYHELVLGVASQSLGAVVRVFSEVISTACSGQWQDVSKHHGVLTVEDYVSLAGKKTGALLLLPLRLVSAAAGESCPVRPGLAENLGVVYQGLNDLENLLEWPRRIPGDLRRQRPCIPLVLLRKGKPFHASQPRLLSREEVREVMEAIVQRGVLAQSMNLIDSHLRAAFSGSDKVTDGLLQIFHERRDRIALSLRCFQGSDAPTVSVVDAPLFLRMA